MRIPCTIACLILTASLAPAAPPLRSLLVGGGPDKENNTAQIEEHLRFVTSLVPASPERIVLFANGRADVRSVSYTDTAQLTPGQRAMDVLLPDDQLGAKLLTRKPELGARIDGPARLAAIHQAFERLAATKPRSPVLLYFAGHGSTKSEGNDGSLYNLWGGENLDAPALAREIELLPAATPVTLVMAQCFSGGFGAVLFKKGDPDRPVADRPLRAFFAAESDREAAGCGTDTESPLYQDFSSYFFGALSGRDRLGRPVTGADYDGDGVVSCYEAFCHALIHDESIDTPVCGSMLFLRRFSEMTDAEIFNSDYSTVAGLATPAQRAALEALSTHLGIDGEHRLLDAYDRLMFSQPVAQPRELQAYRDAQDKLNALRMENLRILFNRWPALRWRDARDEEKAAKGATDQLDKDGARCRQLVETQERFDRADAALDEEEALLVRFTDLCEAIIRARRLREHGDAPTQARFERLWKLEQQPLPLAETAPAAAEKLPPR